MSDYIQLGLGSVAKPLDTSDEALHNNCAMSGSEQTQNNLLQKTQPALQLNFIQLHQEDTLIQYNSSQKQRLKAVILKGQQHWSVFCDDRAVLMFIPNKCSPINISIKRQAISLEHQEKNTQWCKAFPCLAVFLSRVVSK